MLKVRQILKKIPGLSFCFHRVNNSVAFNVFKKNFFLSINYFNNFIRGNSSCNSRTKRCNDDFFSSNFKHAALGMNNPECCTTHLYEILSITKEVLERTNISYFVMYGTLLGSVRHGGMIPWDTDVDLVANDLDDSAIENLIKLLNNCNLSSNYEPNNKVIKVNFSEKNKVHLDIFLLNTFDNKIVSYYPKNEFLKQDFYPPKVINFYDLELPAPFSYKKILFDFYGVDCLTNFTRQWDLTNASQKMNLDIKTPAKLNKKYFEFIND